MGRRAVQEVVWSATLIYRSIDERPRISSRRVDHRRGFLRPVPAPLPARPAGTLGRGRGSGARARRHVVLESLSGRAMRFGKSLVLLFLLQRAVRGVEVVGAL